MSAQIENATINPPTLSTDPVAEVGQFEESQGYDFLELSSAVANDDDARFRDAWQHKIGARPSRKRRILGTAALVTVFATSFTLGAIALLVPRKMVELGLTPIFVLMTAVPVATAALLGFAFKRRRNLSHLPQSTSQGVDIVRWNNDELNNILFDFQSDMSTVGQELLRNRNFLATKFSAVKTDLENATALIGRVIDARLMELTKQFEILRKDTAVVDKLSSQQGLLAKQIMGVKSQIDTLGESLSRDRSDMAENANKQMRMRVGEIKTAFTLAIEDLILQQDQKFDTLARDIQIVSGAVTELKKSIPTQDPDAASHEAERLQKAIEAAIETAMQSTTSRLADLMKSVAQSNTTLGDTVADLPIRIEKYMSNLVPTMTTEIRETSRRSDEFIIEEIKRTASDGEAARAQQLNALEKFSLEIEDASRRSESLILDAIKRSSTGSDALIAQQAMTIESIAAEIHETTQRSGTLILDAIRRNFADGQNANTQHVAAVEKIVADIHVASRRTEAQILEVIKRGVADNEAASVKHALEFKKIADDIYESSRRYDAHILDAIKRSVTENEAASIRHAVALDKIASELQDNSRRSDALILDAIKRSGSDSETSTSQHALAFHKAAKAVADLERSIASGFINYSKTVEGVTSHLPDAIRSQVEAVLKDKFANVSHDLKSALSGLKENHESEFSNKTAQLDQALKAIQHSVADIAIQVNKNASRLFAPMDTVIERSQNGKGDQTDNTNEYRTDTPQLKEKPVQALKSKERPDGVVVARNNHNQIGKASIDETLKSANETNKTSTGTALDRLDQAVAQRKKVSKEDVPTGLFDAVGTGQKKALKRSRKV